MGLSAIWKDYLCRISPVPCPKPIDDAALIRAANTPYRPKGTTPRAGLQPGASPEGIRTDAFGTDYRCCTTETTINLPNAIPPDALPPVPTGGGGGAAIPSPIKTEEIDQDEFRAVGSANGPGFITLLPAQLQNDIDVLEISVQMSSAAASNIQFFVDGTPISANYFLQALQPLSAPGLTVLRTQAVRCFLGATSGIFFEVRWKWKTVRDGG